MLSTSKQNQHMHVVVFSTCEKLPEGTDAANLI